MKFAVERNLEYSRAAGKSLALDLYLPQQARQPLPVILWIHGGQSRYPTPIARLVGNEYAVASLDYRTLDDCRAALRWLRDNGPKYNLDVAHIGVWGFGEGGRLAALLAADPEARLQAAVDFAGPAKAAKSGAPLLIVHGDRDLPKAGADSTLVVVKGAARDFQQLREGAGADTVENFLDKHLKNGAHVRFWLGKIDPVGDAWVDPIIDAPTGTLYRTFPAASLGPHGEASYLIYLPPAYVKDRATRYPVIYYLHGGGGSQRVGDIWVQKLDAAIHDGVIPPMIAVLVEGLPDGRFLDSPDGKRPIESVIMKDLIPHIDATYRTIPRREARVLEGLSMGGYGVFHLGFKYPEMFGMLSGLCNGLSDPAAPLAPGRAPATPADLAANPFVLAEKNLAAIQSRTPIRIIVGTEDFTLPVNEAFHARLTKLGIPHEYRILPNVSHGYKEYYEQLDFSFFKTIATR
jgi:endo-1,4-beta-xylanase